MTTVDLDISPRGIDELVRDLGRNREILDSLPPTLRRAWPTICRRIVDQTKDLTPPTLPSVTGGTSAGAGAAAAPTGHGAASRVSWGHHWSYLVHSDNPSEDLLRVELQIDLEADIALEDPAASDRRATSGRPADSGCVATATVTAVVSSPVEGWPSVTVCLPIPAITFA